VEYVREDEKEYSLCLAAELGSIRAAVVDCLKLYSEGNRNPLTKILIFSKMNRRLEI
jgi:hypothetical protein